MNSKLNYYDFLNLVFEKNVGIVANDNGCLIVTCNKVCWVCPVIEECVLIRNISISEMMKLSTQYLMEHPEYIV